MAPRAPADPATAAPAGAARAHEAVTVLWALAALVHLLGNTAPAYGEALPDPVGGVTVLVALAAGAAALRPRDRLAGIALTLALVLLAAVRLPVLANNLVLLAVVGVGLQASRDPAVALRTVLRAGAAAYAFAAFAKWNTAFLDPAVSCAPLILDRLVASWGLPPVPRPLASAAPVAALLVESAVAVGLLVPRLRRHAAALGVAFHGLLAHDLDQHFWDFTAALLPVFAAAAPGVLLELVDRTRGAVPSRLRGLLTPLGRVVVVLLTLAGVTAALPRSAGPLLALGHLVWLVGGTGLVLGWLAVHVAVRPQPLSSRPDTAGTAARDGRWTPVAIALVALVVANGLTPYLQLKTGYGWNMYANLRVAGEDSNHLVVPAVDLRGDHDDLLAVVDATDVGVRAYAALGVALPRVQLADWVARTPGSRVVARTTAGEEVVLEHGATQRLRPGWLVRVAPLRPVTDTCLLSYGPAG